MFAWDKGTPNTDSRFADSGFVGQDACRGSAKSFPPPSSNPSVNRCLLRPKSSQNPPVDTRSNLVAHARAGKDVGYPETLANLNVTQGLPSSTEMARCYIAFRMAGVFAVHKRQQARKRNLRPRKWGAPKFRAIISVPQGAAYKATGQMRWLRQLPSLAEWSIEDVGHGPIAEILL
jgi:hypothetical protein